MGIFLLVLHTDIRRILPSLHKYYDMGFINYDVTAILQTAGNHPDCAPDTALASIGNTMAMTVCRSNHDRFFRRNGRDTLQQRSVEEYNPLRRLSMLSIRREYQQWEIPEIRTNGRCDLQSLATR